MPVRMQGHAQHRMPSCMPDWSKTLDYVRRITTVYGAPEWRVGQGQTRQPKSGDVWALGATLLEVLFDQGINVTWTDADWHGATEGVFTD